MSHGSYDTRTRLWPLEFDAFAVIMLAPGSGCAQKARLVRLPQTATPTGRFLPEGPAYLGRLCTQKAERLAWLENTNST